MLKPARCYCAVLLFGALLLSPGSVLAEDDGTALQVLIPAVAYGATFYMDDHDGRRQFYQSFFTNIAATYALKKSRVKHAPTARTRNPFRQATHRWFFRGRPLSITGMA